MTVRFRPLWTASSDYSKKPYFLGLRSSKGFIVFVVVCMVFTDIFLYGLVGCGAIEALLCVYEVNSKPKAAPVIPRALEERVHLPVAKVQTWTSILLAVYGGALLFFSPILGYLADRTESRRLPLLLGLLLLTGGTAMLCAGTSVQVFLVGRILQGSSAAMVWTGGIALLADNVEKEEVGQFLGYVAIAMNAGTLLGPLAGGVVYDKGGYFAIYEMAFALIGLDIVLRLVLVEKRTARKYMASTESSNHESLLPQTTSNEDEERSRSYGTGNVTSSGAESTAGSNQKSIWQRRLPPFVWLLGTRRILVAMLAFMAWGLMLTSFDAVLPLFVMQTFGWSSSGSGLIFIAIYLPSLSGPLVGYFTDKYGPRFFAAGGFLTAAPFYMLLHLVTDSSVQQEVLLCGLLAFIGLATTFIATPSFTELAHTVDEKEKERPGIFGNKGATAQAYGLSNSAFAAGCIFGPLFAGLIKDHAGWGTMGWSLGVLCAGTSVPVLLFMDGWIGDRKARPKSIEEEEG